VWWQSLESAWEKNAKAKAQAEKRAQKQPDQALAVKIVGGSTITQQLAKNLFLSGERTLVRKGQELLMTLTLEIFLSKKRILEIYLNNVEWGEGVFGIEAAAQHYFRKSAVKLSAWESARLAVMLPRPRHFEKLPQSPYLAQRAETIMGRMNDVVLP
jgi:monofunctional biosynthetic peptidoglycan transglycosylase